MSAGVSTISQNAPANPISVLMSGGSLKQKPQELKDAWEQWIRFQPPWVEGLTTGIWGGAQGAFFGSLMGSLVKSNLDQGAAAGILCNRIFFTRRKLDAELLAYLCIEEAKPEKFHG